MLKTKRVLYSEAFKIALMGFLIGLSVIGAFIKIPSPTGTIALDSLPGYFTVLYLGLIEGCIVIFLGHIATAATVGFPLGLHGHLFIACGMMLCALVFRYSYKIHALLGIILAALMNGVMLLYLFTIAFQYGWGFFYSMVIPLTVASFVNIVIATSIYEGVKKFSRV